MFSLQISQFFNRNQWQTIHETQSNYNNAQNVGTDANMELPMFILFVVNVIWLEFVQLTLVDVVFCFYFVPMLFFLFTFFDVYAVWWFHFPCDSAFATQMALLVTATARKFRIFEPLVIHRSVIIWINLRKIKSERTCSERNLIGGRWANWIRWALRYVFIFHEWNRKNYKKIHVGSVWICRICQMNY